MTEVPLNPPTPSGCWPPRTGPVPSATVPDRLVSWQADRGWMSEVLPGRPDAPPADAAGMEVTL